jgi:hypothetical protein
MSKVFLLLSDEVDIAEYIEDYLGEFWTILISDDYTDADITATAASGTVTISSYANLLVTAADTVEVAGVVFTAQSGAATLGDATFRAATGNNETATSLAAQINGHSTASALVTASVNNAIVTITANDTGIGGNELTLVYDDNGAEVGLSVSGSGTLTGGDGLNVGTFDGVVGYSTADAAYADSFATDPKRCAFYRDTNGSKNMFFAFGSMLSNSLNWTNQQYIAMPYDDGVGTLGDAEGLFDDKVSFVISDDEFGERLALFSAGGDAIVAPYIKKNLEVDLQSKALTYLSGNQPAYTTTQAMLLQNALQSVIDSYITRGWLTAGTIVVTLVNDNYVASGSINIAKPKALWRVESEIRQTL